MFLYREFKPKRTKITIDFNSINPPTSNSGCPDTLNSARVGGELTDSLRGPETDKLGKCDARERHAGHMSSFKENTYLHF